VPDCATAGERQLAATAAGVLRRQVWASELQQESLLSLLPLLLSLEQGGDARSAAAARLSHFHTLPCSAAVAVAAAAAARVHSSRLDEVR
jgi:hypothetical protein